MFSTRAPVLFYLPPLEIVIESECWELGRRSLRSRGPMRNFRCIILAILSISVNIQVSILEGR